MSLPDRLYSAVLFLNLTGLFSFLAAALGVSIGATSAALLLANALYLGYYARHTLCLIRQRAILSWIVIIGVWPLLTALYAPAPTPRHIGLQLYYSSLLLAAGVFVYLNKWSGIRVLAGWALATTFLGLTLSWLDPEYFATATELAQAPREYGGRAFGFFLQPNMAAANSVFLALVWMATPKSYSSRRLILYLTGVLVIVLSTGSRAGFLIALSVTAALIFYRAYRQHPRSLRLDATLRAARATAVVVIGVGVTVGTLMVARERLTGTLLEEGAARTSALMAPNGSAQLSSDVSATLRLLAFRQHTSLIARRPIFGYGLGTTYYYRETGYRISIASHNAYIEAALNYGLLYLAALLWLLFLLTRHPNKHRVQSTLHSNVVTQLLIAMLLAGLASNTVLGSRVLLITLGTVLAAISFPRQVFRLTNHAGHPPQGARLSEPPSRPCGYSM
jgi:O-antigen ligase